MNTPLNVITLPLAQNNIIEASAGTGKTYTMVTLYLRLLLQAGENNFLRRWILSRFCGYHTGRDTGIASTHS